MKIPMNCAMRSARSRSRVILCNCTPLNCGKSHQNRGENRRHSHADPVPPYVFRDAVSHRRRARLHRLVAQVAASVCGLRAFLTDAELERLTTELNRREYRTHEFGDSVLVSRTFNKLANGK